MRRRCASARARPARRRAASAWRSSPSASSSCSRSSIASFFRLENFITIGVNSTSILIAVLGTSALLIAGYVDLSIGSMVALIGIVVAKVAVATQDPLLAVGTGLALGFCLGLINGILVRKLSISPLIVTLAMLAIYGGLAYVVSSVAVYGFPDALLELGRGKIFGIQYTVLIAVGIFIVGAVHPDADGHRPPDLRDRRRPARGRTLRRAGRAARSSASTRSTACSSAWSPC